MRKILFYLLAFILGGFAYSFFINRQAPPARDLKNYQTSTTIRKKDDSKFISPLLLTGDSSASFVNDAFTKKISDYIANQKNNGNVIDISFYTKNLRNSSWTSVNEDEHYTPASLMKVPILIAILKQSESNPGFLLQKIYYKQTQNYNDQETYLPKKFIVNNNYYTVDDLLEYMIDYSDNNATILLLSLIPTTKISDIFKDLELPLPENNSSGTIDFISAKLYSRLFRVLYNATYLNDENSIKALKLLSNTDFPNGISKGVPENIEVADKFGERTVFDTNQNVIYRELHDCGIVYLENNPYAVCIMTKGKDFHMLEKVIQDLSAMTYQEFE